MKTVAIQGAQASFHDEAARSFFGSTIQIKNCQSFKDVFDALRKGDADQAVIAIENSLYGSINEVYDLLLKHRFWISGEIYLRIRHCLIGHPDASIPMITEVHSHPVALAQCELFLDTVLPNAKRFEHHDTAESVADIKKWRNPHKAAIASEQAARLYDMKVLKQSIETHHQNYTRFVVLETRTPNKAASRRGPAKTSLVLRTSHTPGALHKALSTFAEGGINLSKLQSRPIIGKAWHYIFYVDIEAGYADSNVQRALEQLHEQGCETIILGSYAAASHSL